MSWHSRTQPDLSPGQLFLDVTWSKEEMFKRIKIRTFKADERGRYYTTIGKDDLASAEASFREKRSRPFGRCYSWEPTGIVRTLGVYYVLMEL